MNQEQIQPDYNFILNQDVPQKSGKKPSAKPKVVLLVVMLVLGVASLGVLLFADIQPEQSVATSMTSDETAEEFITQMQGGNLGASLFALLDEPLTTYSEFEVLSLKRMQNGVNFESCSLTEKKPVSEQQSDYIYSCTSAKGEPVRLTLGVIDQTPNAKIISHKVANNA